MKSTIFSSANIFFPVNICPSGKNKLKKWRLDNDDGHNHGDNDRHHHHERGDHGLR